MPDEPTIAEKARKIRADTVAMPPAKRLPRDRPLTPAETEEFIGDYITLLEEGNEVYEMRLAEMAAAETAYRVKKSQQMLLSTHKTGQVKEADGIYQARVELEARDATKAMSDAMRQVQFTRGRILDSLRSLNKNARELAGGEQGR